MRSLFSGYYRPDEAEFEEFWRSAVFVFDTNVLLEAYALPEKAREELLSVLEKLSNRIWIPYQVALEFYRRRFSKVKDTTKGIAELKDVLENDPVRVISKFESIDFEKWNTGIEDIPLILNQLREVYGKLSTALDAVQKKLPSITLDDPIAERISDIFDRRVGSAPPDQRHLDELFKEGEIRYATKVPPGYSDGKKADLYNDRGLCYQAKFGDLLVWRQLLDHVKTQGVKRVIFITADVKDDWWYSEKSGERLGPQPSLIQEFLSQTGADGFWMYTPDRFLESARAHLNVVVADQTVAQVKQNAEDTANWVESVSRTLGSSSSVGGGMQLLSFSAKQQLRGMIAERNPQAALSSGLGIDIAVIHGDQLTDAYHVFQIRGFELIGPKLATIQHFSGTRHRAIIILDQYLLRKFQGMSLDVFSEYLQTMARCEVVSLMFVAVKDDDLIYLKELNLS
jgi:hypothetical protein